MFFRKKKANKTAVTATKEQFTTELLRAVTTQFAIGEEILLRPEYIQGLEVKSIVVGLLVNQRIIYANDDVVWDDESKTITFHSLDDDRSISQVDEVALLMPLENGDDRKMTYQRKEELSRVGLFKRGNTITAMSAMGGRRSYAIDGVVTRYLLLKQGLFANHEVAALNLQSHTFSVSERRKHQRLLTDVPATIRALKGERVFECLLVDYVEGAARFVVDDGATAAVLTVGKPVAVTLELQELMRQYRLEGTVVKEEGNKVVVNFRSIFKDGGYTPFSSLDGIEIKAMLNKLSQSRSG